MHVAIGEGGDVLLVDLAYGIVVVKIGVTMNEDMIEPCAEQAGDSEFEDSGDFIREEGEKSIDEKQDYYKPFKDDVYEEIW